MEEYEIIHRGDDEFEIHVDGQHYANYYILDEELIDGFRYFLLESCSLGDMAPSILARQNPNTYALDYIGVTWNNLEDTVRNEEWF